MNLFIEFVDVVFEGNQAKAAQALEVDRSMVSRMCKGERGVSPAMAERIERIGGSRFAKERFVWPDEQKQH